MTARKKIQQTPSKYDSIIITEYERYKDECGMKIGDHKIFCKVIDRQDKYMMAMLRAHKADVEKLLANVYDIQAVAITGLVRDMLNKQNEEIKGLLNEHKDQLFARIDTLERSLAATAQEIMTLAAARQRQMAGNVAPPGTIQ